ncbi:hypothetical protein LTR78_006898 [Recurvomyces mirabilis]|uniref:Uncharacterized protein n=1 Tax=Recurvomyces mirabilis TaxID=574656 RepID=A0AAE0WKE9_9PEZI|nr:hypothetical protein LTR78_006898 [Recurvomyces mirabilis]KAK5153111.1 hypothetical protein LTS14_007755 [Recurvomyces mirabilis]
MAPRTRRTARSASQDSTTRRSRRLASETPEYEGDLAVIDEITSRNSDLESRVKINETRSATLQLRAEVTESRNSDLASHNDDLANHYSALASDNENLASRIHQLQLQRDEAEARARVLEEAASSNESVAKRKRSIYNDAMQERIQQRIKERKAEATSATSESPAQQNASESPLTARVRVAPGSSQRTSRTRTVPRTPCAEKETNAALNENKSVGTPLSAATSTFAPTDTFAQTPSFLATANQVTPQQQLSLSTRKATPAAQKSFTTTEDATVRETSPQESSMALTQVASPQQQQLDLHQVNTTPFAQDTPRPLWRRMFGAAVGILGELTPVSRKRAATEDTPTTTGRPAKSLRFETSSQGTADEQLGHGSATTSLTSIEQRSSQHAMASREAEHDQTTSQNTSSAQGEHEHDAAAAQGADSPTPSQYHSAPAETSSGLARRSPSKPRTPSRFLMPSTKNKRVPTSLSTVSEYTEPETSYISSFTPSRPPQRRSVASARAARTQSSIPWSNRRKSTTSGPITTSSGPDARWEKLERVRNLQQELNRLNADSDVIEMESHRRKRVKVDSLAWIPHHRPGESSGTFRVPDIDSDDEMEVDETIPERSNVFAEAVGMEVEREKEPVEQEVVEEVVVDVSEFVFPDVGRRRLDEPELASELVRHEHDRLDREFRFFLAENSLSY